MDSFNTPANTATSLGTREVCARIDENDTLDQDEDVTADTLTIDVTATNIPSAKPMITFTYTLLYTEAALTVQTANHDFLLAANGISAFNVSEPLPDTDGNDRWAAAYIDTGTTTPEFGSGVLSRLTISSDATAASGAYLLDLTEASVISTDNQTYVPDAINTGSIAINQACGAPGLTSLAEYVARLYSAIVYALSLAR
ncbi:MAG TPA: hypothetical protein VFP63_08525 [Dehalococcoidia bacterium]|nr:hypothetical protein [Dehalococcoidia bacterium]